MNLLVLQVIQTRYYGTEHVKAVVLRTGFLTAKGSLVRSIMYPPPADFRFDQDSYKFIGILSGIAFLGVLYAIAIKVRSVAMTKSAWFLPFSTLSGYGAARMINLFALLIEK